MNIQNDKEVSMRLYKSLCREIGTEDIVRLRRTYWSSLDYIQDSNMARVISSGSQAEGLDMKESDVDTMVLLNFINVYERIEECTCNNLFSIPVAMEISDTKRGFTRLKLCDPYTVFSRCIHKLCVQLGQDFFLSNELIKTVYGILSPLFNFKIHGPCISTQDDISDLAFCLRCKTWIEQAQPWITRIRTWPSRDLVSKIISYGVLLVPVGSKESPYEDLEWRISFSVAEKQLIYSFSHTQFLVYSLMKIVLKKIIEKSEDLKGLLCSYFLKTLLFWVSEELLPSQWQPHSIYESFIKCFKRLIYCVEYRSLPHYFISEINFFENRFNETQWRSLKNSLSSMYHFGILNLLKSESTLNLCQNDFVISQDQLLDGLCRQIKSYISILHFKYYDGYGRIFRPNRALTLFNKSRVKCNFIRSTLFSSICQKFAEKMMGNTECYNKIQYQRYKMYSPFLLIGVKSDATSGWLYLASYFYCVRRFEVSLQIIEHVLTKFTRSKLYFRNDTTKQLELNAVEYEAYKRKILKGSDIYRRHVICSVFFTVQSTIVPNELKEILRFSPVIINPPVVYAYFLKFLNAYHLHDDYKCARTLHDLHITVKENYFIGNELSMTLSLNCLMICFLMLGITEDAAICFMESQELHSGYNMITLYIHHMLQRIRNGNGLAANELLLGQSC